MFKMRLSVVQLISSKPLVGDKGSVIYISDSKVTADYISACWMIC